MGSGSRVLAKEEAELRGLGSPHVGSVFSFRRAVASDSTDFAQDGRATEDPGNSIS